MTLTLDRSSYGQLLAKFQPKVIASEQEYEFALGLIEDFMGRPSLSAEEDALMDLWTLLIEQYEQVHHPMPASSPQEILLHLMDARSLKQSDLVGILGSKGVVSEIVNGKRTISKAQAKILGQYFNLSPALFI